ncbi:MAG: hypothetical protein U0Q12_17065 [Vicinamibacterales bacterium]
MSVPAKSSPDHHDAELMLRVYELRRESVMRDARNAINGQFWPRTYEDILAVTKADHPLNPSWRQTASYWEMIYGFARHGIVDANFWAEGNGEGLFLYAKVAPHLDRLRAEVNPVMFRNAEWLAGNTVEGRRLFELFTGRVKAALAAK